MCWKVGSVSPGSSQESMCELTQKLSLAMIPGSEQSEGRLGLKVLRKDLGNHLFCDHLLI